MSGTEITSESRSVEDKFDHANGLYALTRRTTVKTAGTPGFGIPGWWAITTGLVTCLCIGLFSFAVYGLLAPDSIPEPAETASSPEDSPVTMDSQTAARTITGETQTDSPVARVERTARTITLRKGDTLLKRLRNEGAAHDQAYQAIVSLKDEYDPRKLREGQKLVIVFEEPAPANPETGNTVHPVLPSQPVLANLTLKTDVDREVQVNRTARGVYETKALVKELTIGYVQARGRIDSSLFLSATKAGLPPAIIIELIRMYSYDIDFQRDIRAGDTFEVFFTRYYDTYGTPLREGKILYASMNVRGRKRPLWRYGPTNGVWDYFDRNGRSMKKFLMRTPIDGARISSGFGRRRHPVLGYTKMHAGTDFAAPKGTPVYAAGNGIVEKAQRYGSYGKYIKIRHVNGYKTAYAHLNGYARGIRKGRKVRQGQTIGYVGSTGRSTGPHLHYEVHIHNKKVNPQRIRVPTGHKLSGHDLAHFFNIRRQTDLLRDRAPVLTKTAQVQMNKAK